MFKSDFIEIEFAKNENGYLIKDKNQRLIAKVKIVEYSHKNKNCTFRLQFYANEGSYEYITYIIKAFISMMFDNAKLFKINVLIGEDLCIQPFYDLNFRIEGIITNNSLVNYKYNNEILMGIDYDTYKKVKKITALTLKGKKINLRILTVNDADKLLNYYKKNEQHLRKFEELKDEKFYTLENQIMLINGYYLGFLNGNFMFFGIFKNENIIGVINLYNIIGGMFKDATIGYSIDEDEQGKGYMREAVNIISDYAFNVLKLHRLQAATLIDNTKSQFVLKACGFKEIGISEEYLFINGEWQDQCIFYKLNIQKC